MISKSEEVILTVALSNERIASEIVARVIDTAPADAAAAQAILDIIKPSKKESKEIEEYLVVALTSRKYGKEIAGQLEVIVECLKHQVDANDVALAVAQSKLSPLSKEATEYLVVACANRSVAKSISDKINVAITSASSISTSPSAATFSGTMTITSFADLSADSVSVDGGTYLEGIQWFAATTNDATANSLASAIQAGVQGVTALAVGPVITITANATEVNPGDAFGAVTMVYNDAAGGVGMTVSGPTLTAD